MEEHYVQVARDIATAQVNQGQACTCPKPPNGCPPAMWKRAWSQALASLTVATGWGGCDVPDVEIARGPDGCATQVRRCRTPIPIGPVSLTNADPDTVIPIPTVGDGYVTHLMLTQTGVAGDISLVSLKQGSREYFPNGALPAELYTRSWDSVGNLLPNRVRLKPDVRLNLTVRANVVGPVILNGAFLAMVAEE